MGIRLDQVSFSTLHEAPKNYGTKTVNIAISGSVASGATADFSGTIAYERGGTRADVYLTGNSVKVLANTGDRSTYDAYTPVSSETFASQVEYSSTDITVKLKIFNGTGSPITLTNQTIVASVVLYDSPITAI